MAIIVDGVKYNVDSPQGIGHTKHLSDLVLRFLTLNQGNAGPDTE